MGQGKKELGDILAQWRRERPDLDPAVMEVCGAMWRKADWLRQEVAANASRYDLDFPGLDVLLTLRRQGRGEALSPSALAKEMMLSSSAMTNRLDRLEARSLIERRADPEDRRGLQVVLSETGFALADDLVASHVETEERVLAPLSRDERAQLLTLLAKLGPDER